VGGGARPRFSRFVGGLRIGADFFEREGALALREPAPRGVVDRMADLANTGIDVSRVHPAVVVFFEDTASLELLVRSRWRFPFSVAWRVARGVMRLVGQFVLPVREARIVTRVHGLDAERDGRADARAVVRTYDDGSGGVMQAVAYATWERDGTRYMSAAFPLPGGHMAGILRLDAIAEDDEGRLAVALTSSSRADDDAGVWFVVGPLAFPSPFGERLELYAAGTPCAPRDLDADGGFPDATIVGRHEQRFFGVRFVTHHYWFRPASCVDRGAPSRS
jgi:hypothetical protein